MFFINLRITGRCAQIVRHVRIGGDGKRKFPGQKFVDVPQGNHYFKKSEKHKLFSKGEA